jgi:hypothetical protein
MRSKMTALACAAFLCACGGGGGDGSSAASAYRLTFSQSTLTAATTAGASAPLSTVATVDRPIPEAVNVAVIDTHGVISPNIVLTPLSTTSYSVQLSTSASLPQGHYTGTLEVRLCHDAPLTCSSPVPGSPWTIAYDITVGAASAAPAPASPPSFSVTFDTSPITVANYAGELPTTPLSAQFVPVNGAGMGYPKLVDPNGVFAPNPPATVNGSSFTATLSVDSSVAPGTYQGQLELHVCKDLPCSAEFDGSPGRLSYTVKIMPAANLTPLATLPGAAEWSMHQANAAHSGYVPVTLDPGLFNRRWRWLSPASTAAGSSLSPAVTSAGLLYLSRSGYFAPADLYALNESDGAVGWTYSFGTIFAVNPPSVGAGKVFVATSGHQDTFMWSFAADSGAQQSKVPFGAQWEHYYAPTIKDGAVYTNGGSYGGLLSFSANDGSLNWFDSALPQYDQWTPAVDDNYAYGFMSNTLYAVAKSTGVNAFSIPGPSNSWNGYSVSSAPLLGSAGRVVTVDMLSTGGAVNNLVSFDVAGRTVAWTVAGRFSREPAFANGKLYVVNGSQLESRPESDGALQWSWSPAETTLTPFDGLSSNVVVTDNLVFVSTASAVYAVDLVTHQAVWSYPKAGRLALSPRGVLYIVTPAGTEAASVIAVNLQ